MECIVNFSDGRPDAEYDTIQAAVEALLTEWPDGVVYDAGGFEQHAYRQDEDYDIRGGRIALVWACEADAINNPGTYAVASIDTREEE